MSRTPHTHTPTVFELETQVTVLELCQGLNDAAVAHLACALLCGVSERLEECQNYKLGEWIVSVHTPDCADNLGLRLQLAKDYAEWQRGQPAKIVR